MNRTPIARLFLGLLCGLCTPVVAGAQPETTAPVIPAIHDGVVVDAIGGTAFIMHPDGGVAALDLTSGTRKWTNPTSAKPLMVVERTLVVQVAGDRGEFILGTMEASSGAIQQRLAVSLPVGLRAHLVGGPSETFRVRAFAGENATPIVTWAFVAGPLSGVPPAPDLPPAAAAASARGAAPASVETAGAVRLDLASGRAIPLSVEEAQALIRRPDDDRTARAAIPGARQLTSVDARHVLHSERVPNAAKWWAPYRWTIVDAAGTTVGTIEAPVSIAPFAVAGSRVFYVAQPATRRVGTTLVPEPLRLRALDLRSGAERWAMPVVDTKYRGPMPP